MDIHIHSVGNSSIHLGCASIHGVLPSSYEQCAFLGAQIRKLVSDTLSDSSENC